MTDIFEIADSLVEDACSLDPVLCTYLGVPGPDHLWGEGFGLAGVEAERELREAYQPRIEPFLDTGRLEDRLAAQVIAGSHEESERGYQEGDHLLELSHMASPFHSTILDHGAMRLDLLRQVVQERLAG